MPAHPIPPEELQTLQRISNDLQDWRRSYSPDNELADAQLAELIEQLEVLIDQPGRFDEFD